ncbi:hypothetical protein MCOR17_011185 [Pyricularia oryzae]|nr:hypothetical protein MCOR17_011185 [Pyricularia oryzae]
MVENKCIKIDNAQNSLNNGSASPKLNTDQWQALIALHRTLLHEHHDFFLASQHPSANPALRRLAVKYAMPARMWRHGIHSFLELLRHRLPHSLEYMLTFIYSSYSMMALLYETVPAFEYTWIECLGDLSRYRMAIEDDDVRDREVWTAVSRDWYSRASDKAPTTGRLYHHLAILAKPNVVAQLFYYAKSLCVPIPFNSARDSILTLFEPIMAGTHGKLHAVDRALVRCHGTFFTGKGTEDLEDARNEFLSNLDLAVAKGARCWLEAGYQIAVTNLCALLDYGLPTNVLIRALDASTKDSPMPKIVIGDEPASAKSQKTSETQKPSNTNDENAPVATATEAKDDVVDLSKPGFEIPEKDDIFKLPRAAEQRPLPENWAMRGLVWAEMAFPADHFNVNKNMEKDERTFETPSMKDQRRKRCLWFVYQIAQIGTLEDGVKKGRWITYNTDIKKFRPAA